MLRTTRSGHDDVSRDLLGRTTSPADAKHGCTKPKRAVSLKG